MVYGVLPKRSLYYNRRGAPGEWAFDTKSPNIDEYFCWRGFRIKMINKAPRGTVCRAAPFFFPTYTTRLTLRDKI